MSADSLTTRVLKEMRAERDAAERARLNRSRIHIQKDDALVVPPAPLAFPSKLPIVELASADTIEPAPINWLWDGWLAKGAQLLAGQPGTGKTTLALASRR